MKLINKLLIPALAITSTGIATSCGCSFVKPSDGLTSLDKKYFEIDGSILKGFKDEYHQVEDIDKGDYKLTIFKDITKLDDSAFTYSSADYDAMFLIKKIDFEDGCKCQSFGISSFGGCKNIETVVLPPKFNSFGSALFNDCAKLTSFDLTNINQTVSFVSWTAPIVPTWPKTGVITYLKDNSYQKALATKNA